MLTQSWNKLVLLTVCCLHYGCPPSSEAKSVVRSAAYDSESAQLPILAPPTTNYQDHPTACRPPFTSEPDSYPNFQCGLLEVPLDYLDPSTGKGRVYYARYPASPNTTRKGTIFLDPGHPFAAAFGLDPQTWLLQKGETLHNRTMGEYDIVVWQARGKGSQFDSLTIPGPVRCFENAAERNAFYARTAAALGFSPSWNDHLEYTALQGDQDILHWHAVQENVIQHCLANTNQTMLQYMGTAATARDLIAMADTFDGPQSPVHFWAMGEATLIGRYLLKIFPERAGRIVMDNMKSPESYTQINPYERWKEQVTYANITLAAFEKDCLHDGASPWAVGCRVAHLEEKDEDVVHFATAALAVARGALMGWRNQLNIDMGDVATSRHFLETVREHTMRPAGTLPNITQDVAFLNKLVRLTDETLGLGLMPIACGDLAFDHDSKVMSGWASEMPGALLSSKSDATLLLRTAVPSLQYMCHLWPFRAVERIHEFTLPCGQHMEDRVLLISNRMNPMGEWLHFLPFEDGCHGELEEYPIPAWVRQIEFSIPSFFHSRCMNRQILRFLRHGRAPTTAACYGNGAKVNWPGAEDTEEEEVGFNATVYDSKTTAVRMRRDAYPLGLHVVAISAMRRGPSPWI